ncbi:MAG: tetratricopeptide repeat protein [Treponemataceae bacterium]|nr:tetratricopeptide repeat protein [Treponemataceae bacterium]MDE7226713.1 tetratricopeptide repeat protein [Treponemataceae bacterium]
MADRVKNDTLAEGIALYKKADYAASLAFFLSLPDDTGIDNGELAYFIGLCYTKLERYDDALLYLEQVVTAGQDIDRVLQCRFILAIVYSLTGRRKLADFELQKLAEAAYKPAAVYAALAYNAWTQHEVDLSISYYKKALEIDPENPTALNGMGYVLASENRDLAAALSYCKRALDRSPRSAACMDSVGWVYLKLGLYDEARKYLHQARDLMPDNAEIQEHIRLAQVS